MKNVIRQIPAAVLLIVSIVGFVAIKAQIRHYDKLYDEKIHQGTPVRYDYGSTASNNFVAVHGRWHHHSPTNGIRN